MGGVGGQRSVRRATCSLSGRQACGQRHGGSVSLGSSERPGPVPVAGDLTSPWVGSGEEAGPAWISSLDLGYSCVWKGIRRGSPRPSQWTFFQWDDPSTRCTVSSCLTASPNQQSPSRQISRQGPHLRESILSLWARPFPAQVSS